jgi:hypothetical protein
LNIDAKRGEVLEHQREERKTKGVQDDMVVVGGRAKRV